jgi:hypothetical protein
LLLNLKRLSLLERPDATAVAECVNELMLPLSSDWSLPFIDLKSDPLLEVKLLLLESFNDDDE